MRGIPTPRLYTVCGRLFIMKQALSIKEFFGSRMFNLSSSPFRKEKTFDTKIDVEQPVSFSSESELVQTFTTNSHKNISNHLEWASELNAGNGIADIVLYNTRKDWKNNSSLAMIRPQMANSLVALPYRKSFDIEYFSSLACISKSTSERVLKEFSLAGYCDKSASGWIKLKQPRPPIANIYAIEAKLKDWRRALLQATSYQEFANQSWVLMDSKFCKKAMENKLEFTKRNVGLISISPDGKLNPLIGCSTIMPKSQYRFWYANVLLLASSLRP